MHSEDTKQRTLCKFSLFLISFASTLYVPLVLSSAEACVMNANNYYFESVARLHSPKPKNNTLVIPLTNSVTKSWLSADLPKHPIFRQYSQPVSIEIVAEVYLQSVLYRINCTCKIRSFLNNSRNEIIRIDCM